MGKKSSPLTRSCWPPALCRTHESGSGKSWGELGPGEASSKSTITMATNVPGIWAIGDVTGKLMLAHAGMAMGMVCAETIAGKRQKSSTIHNMPKATYCHPQVASFGLTEEDAMETGHEITVGKFNFQANGKALGLNDYAGWVKS